jgi:GT2 family glycosyltransferase
MANFNLVNLGENHLSETLSNLLNESIEDLEISSICDSNNGSNPRKVFFKLFSNVLGKVHITCGLDLKETWDNLKQAHDEIPKLTCKPLFYFTDDHYEILGQTFFDGIPIDSSLEEGILNEESVHEILGSIQSTFVTKSENSTKEELFEELEGFLRTLKSIKKLTNIDSTILENMGFPYLRENANNFIPTKRWSNGDLAARNILVSKDGQFRIIDWEFAKKTHFADEDWVRLKFYSKPQLKSCLLSSKYKIENQDFFDVFFWLKQLYLDYQVHTDCDVDDYLQVNLTNAFLNTKFLNPCDESKSLLLEGINKEFNKVERKFFVEFHNRLDQETQKEEIKNKLERVTKSFSWRATGFLRYLRRKIIDPRKDKKKIIKSSFKQKRKDKEFDYSRWIKKRDQISYKRKIMLQQQYKNLNGFPLLSIVLPIFDPEEEYLKLTIKSVLNQIYQNWELSIVNDASTKSFIKPYLNDLADNDERIKVIHRETNGHITKATNEGVAASRGEYIVFLDHDDLLRSHSLLRIVKQINKNPRAGLIYSDEDKVDLRGKRYDHYFKPDWNPDLFLSQNYICHLVCCKKEYFTKVGGLEEGIEGSQDWDFLLKVTEVLEAEQIIHIPEILYHWRASENSTALSLETKKYVLDKSTEVLNNCLKRRGVAAKAEISDKKNGYVRIKYILPEILPLVSILIPTCNRLDLITRCVETILERTSYQKLEILVLDHNSDEPSVIDYFSKIDKIPFVRIIKIKGEFNFSKINNYGVSKANGDILLFLNNDIEVLENDWLTELVSQVSRKEIGCVGAKLLYPNNTVQHGGVIVGLGGVAGHSHKHYSERDSGYKHRLQLVQNYLAVTAACLAVRKEVFELVGGFNETDLKVAFNDVDLCLRVFEMGYRNLWTPYALLKHHESASRGKDTAPDKIERFKKEINYMQNRWKKYINYDPYYNKNLNKNRENFSLAFEN